MTNTTKTQKGTKKGRTVQAPPAIVRIHRPVLTEEERAKRMKEVEKAAIKLILAAERAHARQAAQKEQEKNEQGV